MSKLEDTAKLVANHMTTKQEVPSTVSFNPLTILAVMQLLVEVIKLIHECKKKPGDVAKLVANPGIVSKMKLRTVVRRHLAASKYQDLVGRDSQVAKGVLEVAKTLPEAFVTSLFSEVPA